jgi:hypothetical protein
MALIEQLKSRTNNSFDMANDAVNFLFDCFERELLIKTIAVKVRPYSILRI